MPGAAREPAAGGRTPRVLFVCADPVGKEMAGLGIRCWELARTLSAAASVTVAHGGSEQRELEGVRLIPFRPHAPGALRAPIAQADTIVAHPQWPLVDRWLKASSARIVIDLYCPETLETLELTAGRSRLRRHEQTATTLDRLHAALRTGHNFICASESQRDLWIGAMLALRLIGPELYDHDASLRETVDLVPFGVPREPPAPSTGDGPRETIAALDADSELVLWNGGIWRWLDAPTAIRAVAALAQRRPKLRLVFMGGAADHPAAAQSTREARELAQQLGLLGSVVHFHDSWVPYAQRGAWLTQADCAISAHAEHLETRFAYRTRLLDCFWAGLPIVCTSGDDLADYVARERLGAVAPPQDVGALAAALEEVLASGRDSYSERLATAAEQQSWERMAEPLARWIAAPRPTTRPGDSPGALRAPLAQHAREAAYRAGGRALLNRRRG
ncbi:MAG TPA: glycosyltransferase family 4 protein [Solirubrobacteraceae bacterium]|jgi:glycosyltransferase involved in cell wall biosynthesis|nr:glycosyltransferase family 4 protein [Solirubrobacteraceae bacterium]